MTIEQHLPGIAARLHAIAAAAVGREACGIITGAYDILELQNRAPDPANYFDIGPLDALQASEAPIRAIWHTHPADEPPSPMDAAGCQATNIPWIIAGPSKLWCLHARPIALEGRDFLYGTNDCWQLISDWYAKERGVYLPWFNRPPDGWWESDGESPYLTAAKSYGFEATPVQDCGLDGLQRGDVILMRIAARQTNHAAVYIGGGEILHHLYGQLSVREQLCTRYQRTITHIARFIEKS